MSDSYGKKISILLTLTMISMVFLPFATAFDTDMDGTHDTVDDCIRASGTSSIDRTGCPDRDGDGKSDIMDGWTTPNPNFQTEFVLTSQNDYRDIEFSPTGEFLVTVEDGTFVRKWNSTSFVNVLSVSLGSSNTGTSVAYSSDGNYIAAGLSNDAINIWYADNFTSVNGEISVDVGSGDYVYDVEFSPDSQTLAVTIGRSGNSGTNGQSKIINVSSGLQEASYNPSGEDRFYDAAFSPDGSMLALGGEGDWYVVNTSSGAQAYSNSAPADTVHGIAWSPDGNYIALCIGYDNGNAKIQIMKVNGNTWTQQWIKSHTTSCASVDFSPDGSQVVFGLGYYQASGSTAYVYQTDSGLSVDTFDFRPSQGCNSWQGNPCGEFSGISWHPDGIHIVTTVSRNFEGLYYWYADLDEDNDGYNTTDQGDGIVDSFPTDGTQWNDTDSDGFGDNPAPANQPDACITTWGNSTQDRFGCLDTDGDGYSNEDTGWTITEGADTFPADGTQWIDTDGDGVGDNNIQGTHYTLNSSNLLRFNQTGDSFPNDNTQWNDTDGDGWGDNFVNVSWLTIRPAQWPGDLVSVAEKIDTFPLDRTQWMDTDGDWVGDNELSDRTDGCPNIWGDSEFDRLGCLDTDGDGWSDPDANWPATTDCYGADAFPNEPTQWCDEDNDGYGSNETGNNADECPNEAGTSTVDRVGCSDRDGDGYSNAGDPFPDHPDQWADRDGDGYGDNPAPAYKYDTFPDDTSQQRDTDGDGYGDSFGGFNGDKFPNDDTQWADTDGDGYGDNFIDQNNDGISEGMSDVCPLKHGSSTNPVNRGCPDTDLDGFMDPSEEYTVEDGADAFPEDPFQWADSDGDGYGDNLNGTNHDDCIEVPGTSFENNTHGCPDSDLDGWADVDDAFPKDIEQWLDTDGDGFGDNYFYTNTTIEDLDYPGVLLNIREQRGDAFPEISDQWSDMDGDGWGDNQTSFFQPDAFPLHPSQWNDFDGDGYGDSVVKYDPDGEQGPLPSIDSWQPDGCRKEAGTSIGNPAFNLDWGCPDSDNDGIQNSKDPCPWDPEISSGAFGQDCGIKTDPSINSDNAEESSLAVDTELLTTMAGVIVFLLALIFVAQVAKAAGKKKLGREKAEERLVNDAFADEEQRRQTWVEHYVNQGELDKARELGWNGLALPSQIQEAAVPQWKQHEIDQQTQQDAATPAMLDLDNL